MEQCESISFSSMIAAILLCKRNLSSGEIVNMNSKLCCEGFVIDDFDDDITCLISIVNITSQCHVELKEELTYQSLLYNGVTVKETLEQYANKQVLEFLLHDRVYGNCYREQFGTLSCEEVFRKEKIVTGIGGMNTLKRLRKKINQFSRVSFLG